MVIGSDFLNRFGLPLQGLHFSIERSLELARRAPEFAHCFADRPAYFGEFLRPEQEQSEDKDEDHFRYTQGTHLDLASSTEFYPIISCFQALAAFWGASSRTQTSFRLRYFSA